MAGKALCATNPNEMCSVKDGVHRNDSQDRISEPVVVRFDLPHACDRIRSITDMRKPVENSILMRFVYFVHCW